MWTFSPMASSRSRTARSTSASRPLRDSRPAMRRKVAIRAAASMLRSLQPLFDPALHRGQRLRQPFRIRAAGLRHVRAPAALAADLRGDEIYELSGFHLRDEVLGDARDQAHLLALGARQHDGAGLQA